MRYSPARTFQSLLLKIKQAADSIRGNLSDEQQDHPFARIGSLWWGYVPVFLVTILGISITLYLFRQVSDWETQQVTTAFNEASQDRVLVVRREIEFAFSTIRDLASYFDASPKVGRREFRKFVEPAIVLHKGIEALEWIPLVAHEERKAFEREARISFPPYSIKEIVATGEIRQATNRDEYLPILYVQPYQSNKELLGLDMASDRTFAALLSRSLDAKQMQVSKIISLGDEQGTQNGFAVSVPVYHSNEQLFISEEKGLKQAQFSEIRGFAVGIFRIGDIVERALESLSVSGIDIRFIDETDSPDNIVIYTHISRQRTNPKPENTQTGHTRLNYTQTFLVGGRKWKLVSTPIPGSYQTDSWSGWIVIVGGFSFTPLLTIYVSTLVGRARKVKRLVDLRTAELNGAVNALNNEIVDRKAAERKLMILNDDLEYRVAVRSSEAERRAHELEQFAYVASHDLKAPLRAIGTLAGWIGEDLEGKLTNESREQLSLLQDRVQRMNALIEGLLEYSRLGRTEGSDTLVNTRELLEEIIDSLSPPKGFCIKLGKELPEFHTDRLLLGQVFSNLISNSLKHHGGKKGHIKIECRSMRHFYEFSVSDNGAGIAPEYHKKVFMIFQTLHAKDYGSNTGIGLALVKKIVQEQGGWITLESEPGKGALFRFTWPEEHESRSEAV